VIDPKEGEIYYEVTFIDSELKFPRMEPMIYVGKNLFEIEPEDEADEDRYCFQYATQAEGGDSSTVEGYGDIHRFSKADLNSLHSIEGALAKIALVAAGVKLGKPRNDWVF